MGIISGRIYKPERILYYIQPTLNEKKDFFEGKMPASLMAYDGAFGTYDCPGLFLIDEGDKQVEVLGIEFRPNDSRISYPEGLSSITLPQGFMISSLLTNVDFSCDTVIWNLIDEIREDIEALCHHNNIIIPSQRPELIQMFTQNGKTRILIKAKDVSADEFFHMINPETDNEKNLYNAAYHDQITGHYNWNYIWPIIAGFGLKGIQDFAYVHFDVKEFKALNVVYGHDVANRVLSRIVKHMNETDWIYYSARCDNDNFAMMIKDMPEDETRKRLLDFFNDISILDEDNNYHIYYRCGVVPMKNTLLLGDRVADAGKQVQRMGSKLYETEVLFCSDSINDVLDWSIKTKTYLDTAIKQEEFLVYFQPKYDSNEKIYGAEALIRWNYHGKELLSPGQFIPVFETGGLISKLDDFVLHKVCQYLKKWEKDGLPLYPISVNLSRKSLGNPNMAEHLSAIVDSCGVDHSLIEFELTESAAFNNQNHLVGVISELKEKGFKISIDDFGTGYSSLSLLDVMPMDTIKIDKSFVDKIRSTPKGCREHAVLKHMIAMIKDLNLTSLAEGVEEKEQLDVLLEMGCEVIQGFYYSRPLPADSFESKLAEA